VHEITNKVLADAIHKLADQQRADSAGFAARLDAVEARKDAATEEKPAVSPELAAAIKDAVEGAVKDAFAKRVGGDEKHKADDEDPEAEGEVDEDAEGEGGHSAGKGEPGEPREMASDSRRDRSRRSRDDALNHLAAVETAWQEVALMHGERPDRARDGEKAESFDRRMASRFRQHSPRWKDVDLCDLSSKAQRNAIDDIRKDAIAAGCRPLPGQQGLREVKRADATGRLISEFVGDVEHALGPFKAPVMRLNTSFGLNGFNASRDNPMSGYHFNG
jgi:hypothetical protein